MKRTLLTLALLAALSANAAYAADPALEARLKALEERVATLEHDAAAQKARADEATEQLQQTQAALAALKSAPSPSAAPPTAADDVEAMAAAVAAGPEEAQTAAASTPEAAADSVASSEGDSGSGASNPNSMNPAISIILNGQYVHHSLDPDTFQRAGFPLAGEAGPGPQGFSLGESEVSFASNIDEKFYGQLTFSMASEDGEDKLGIEEAYIETTALPHSFAVRAGLFFSNIGYLNNHHAHTDNFWNRPLAYQAFLGNQYGDDGVQLRWVAPTSTYIELGGEMLRGENFPSGGAAHAGAGVKTLFAHFGGDAGSESSWLAGISALDSHTENGEDGFSGHERLYIADGTWKWAPGGNTKDGGVTLRGEYLLEHRDGIRQFPDTSAPIELWDGTRSGGYLEAVWRINRQWDAGYRYDRLWADDEGPVASDFDPSKHSVELTWRNSEFSLLRLQLSRERANETDTDSTVSVQYQASLGAHGAHKF
jgi:hypothetical protein